MRRKLFDIAVCMSFCLAAFGQNLKQTRFAKLGLVEGKCVPEAQQKELEVSGVQFWLDAGCVCPRQAYAPASVNVSYESWGNLAPYQGLPSIDLCGASRATQDEHLGYLVEKFDFQSPTNIMRFKEFSSVEVRAMRFQDLCLIAGNALRDEEVELNFSVASDKLARALVAEIRRRGAGVDLNRIARRQIRIGDSDCQIFGSWGEPRDTNTMTSSAGTRIQYVFNSSYVYTMNGRITTIQD